MLEIENTGKTEGQQAVSVARPALSLVTRDIQHMMRNIIIWIIAVLHPKPAPSPPPLSVCLTLWLFFGPEQVFVLEGFGGSALT